MATAKQIAANRRNASRSTGPRTRDGKTTSSRNALRHGLSAMTVLIDGEDAAEFSQFVADLKADFGAQTVLVRTEVEQLACLYWQRQRIRRVHAGILSAQQRNAMAQVLRDRLEELDKTRSELLLGGEDKGLSEDFGPILKAKIRKVDRLYEDVGRDLDDLLKEERPDDEKLAAVFMGDVASLAKLQRFETANERAVQRCYDRILSMMSRLTGPGCAEVINVEVVSDEAVAKR